MRMMAFCINLSWFKLIKFFWWFAVARENGQWADRKGLWAKAKWQRAEAENGQRLLLPSGRCGKVEQSAAVSCLPAAGAPGRSVDRRLPWRPHALVHAPDTPAPPKTSQWMVWVQCIRLLHQCGCDFGFRRIIWIIARTLWLVVQQSTQRSDMAANLFFQEVRPSFLSLKQLTSGWVAQWSTRRPLDIHEIHSSFMNDFFLVCALL